MAQTRADRQVDAAGGDHQRHAQRDQDQRRAQPEDVDQAAVQVAVVASAWTGSRVGRSVLAASSATSTTTGQNSRCRRQRPVGRPCVVGHDCAPLLVPRAAGDRLHDPVGVDRVWSLVELRDHLAVAHHGDLVAEAEHLLQLGGDEQHRHAAVGQLHDQLLDLGLGADVDAAGGLVEDQQARLGDQPAGQQHLLLVAAGEVAHRHVGVRRPDAQAPARTVRPARPAGGAGIGRSQPRAACMARMMFSRTDSSAMMPSARRFSEQKPMPVVDGGDRRPQRGRACRPPRTLPWSARSAPNSSRATSVRPEPSRPARPTTSPAWMVRLNGRDRARAAQLACVQQAVRRSAGAAASLPGLLVEPLQHLQLLADHLLDQAELRQLARRRTRRPGWPLRSTVIRSAMP